MADQKKIIQILNKLGHCIKYDCVMETARVQQSLELIESMEHSFLSLGSATENDQVLTVFWVDNLDKVNFQLP